MKKFLIVFTDILLIIFLIFVPHISSMMIESGYQCYFLKNGIICPSCGGTRCVNSFFNGKFKKAFIYNFAIFCGLLLIFFIIILININIFFKNKFCTKIIRLFFNPKTLILLIFAYVVLGILRNFFDSYQLILAYKTI